MTATLITGGARSGKSRLAVEMARRSAGDVVFVATATAGDEEMATRIAAHRLERPAAWSTVEEPMDLIGAVASIPPSSTVVVDCVTMWVSNLLLAGRTAEDIRAQSETAVAILGAAADSIVVTNEVGLGIVPENALARAYRDILGSVNAVFGAVSDRVLLTVAGRVVEADRW